MVCLCLQVNRDSSGMNRAPPGQTGFHPGGVPVHSVCYHFQYRQTPEHNCGATGVNRDATGVNRDATGVNRGESGRYRAEPPGHTGLHRDDTGIEPGPRPGLHQGNTMINFGRDITSVCHVIPACLHRGRTGTVRTGLKST